MEPELNPSPPPLIKSVPLFQRKNLWAARPPSESNQDFMELYKK